MLILIFKADASAEIVEYGLSNDVWIWSSEENAAAVEKVRKKHPHALLTIGQYPHLRAPVDRLEALLDEALEHVRRADEIGIVGFLDEGACDRVLNERGYSLRSNNEVLRLYAHTA